MRTSCPPRSYCSSLSDENERQSLRLAIEQLLQLMRPNDLDVLKQTTGGETQSTLETFFARTSKAWIVIVQEICSSLDQLIRNCSFTDSEKRLRLRLVRRAVSVPEIFSNFFHSLPPTRNSHALWHCFRPLLAFADRVDRFPMLSDSSLSEFEGNLHDEDRR